MKIFSNKQNNTFTSQYTLTSQLNLDILFGNKTKTNMLCKPPNFAPTFDDGLHYRSFILQYKFRFLLNHTI